VTRTGLSHGAVVLGGEVNGIAVVRSLGRLGVRCGLLSATARADHSRKSKYLSSSEVVPVAADDAAVEAAIRRIASRIGGYPVVLIPTTDRFSQYLSRNLSSLGSNVIACNPEPELCDTFLDKWKTADLCARNGVLTPHTACPKTKDELAEVAARIVYPVIVKPRYTFATGFPGKNAVVQDARQLTAFLADESLLGRCVVQEIVRSGDGDILVTATYSNSQRRVQAIYSGRKLRQYLPDYGATCFGISERNPELESLTRRFLDDIGYQGFAALEFARSRDDGKAYFLELNTRTYYHNQLFADVGIDLTQVAYLDAIGRDFTAMLGPLKQRDGVIWLDYRRDFMSMRIKRRQGRITVAGWFLSILRARSFAYWSPYDPLPFAAACLWRCRELVVALLRRAGLHPTDAPNR
jgi:predicted ATP-grasp superfamily ATP-dependent carboligase